MPAASPEKPEQIRLDVPPSDHVTALAYRAAPHNRTGAILILAIWLDNRKQV